MLNVIIMYIFNKKKKLTKKIYNYKYTSSFLKLKIYLYVNIL